MHFREGAEKGLFCSPFTGQEPSCTLKLFSLYDCHIAQHATGIQNYIADVALVVNFCDCKCQEYKITLLGRSTYPPAPQNYLDRKLLIHQMVLFSSFDYQAKSESLMLHVLYRLK